MQQDVALVQVRQPRLPHVGNRAFLRQQRPGPELESDRAQLGIVDPVCPVTQVPHTTCHHDRNAVGDAALAHHRAQLLHPRIGVLRRPRVFRIRQAIVPAGQPRILIDHCAQPLARLRIGALPQRAERSAGRDDRIVENPVPCRDFAQLVGHARAAGHAMQQPLGLAQHAFQHPLRAAHFPQNVDVERPAPRPQLVGGDVIGAAHLLHGTADRIGNQLLVPAFPRPRGVDLRDHIAILVIAVGVHGRHRAQPARLRPGAGRRMVGGGHTLAAFHKRQERLPAHSQCTQSLQIRLPSGLPNIRPSQILLENFVASQGLRQRPQPPPPRATRQSRTWSRCSWGSARGGPPGVSALPPPPAPKRRPARSASPCPPWSARSGS